MVYKKDYVFDSSINKMRTDCRHFLLTFHDVFIEVIASGLWLETSNESFEGKALSENHPFNTLNKDNVCDIIGYLGTDCEIRRNNTSFDSLSRLAKWCSQTLYEFHLLPGDERDIPMYSLKVKFRSQKVVYIFTNNLNREILVSDQLPSMQDLQEIVIEDLKEIHLAV